MGSCLDIKSDKYRCRVSLTTLKKAVVDDLPDPQALSRGQQQKHGYGTPMCWQDFLDRGSPLEEMDNLKEPISSLIYLRKEIA